MVLRLRATLTMTPSTSTLWRMVPLLLLTRTRVPHRLPTTRTRALTLPLEIIPLLVAVEVAAVADRTPEVPFLRPVKVSAIAVMAVALPRPTLRKADPLTDAVVEAASGGVTANRLRLLLSLCHPSTRALNFAPSRTRRLVLSTPLARIG